ncbi:glycosyltransferase family 2 protein [Baekduia soli]|uniref:glycosyltransferase family 2 protein n=1 Tax=Baekduia soli TaxID=496014 RepID=UPI0016523AB9|nr:glycosyltransferase [Baekduia soli]
MALASLTVAVASHQRREALLRLLRGLDEQLAADAALRAGVRIVVVLDGSTDGSREAVEAAAWTVPVEVLWQPNRGLAAARNAGLRAAGDGLVWFLDDDLVLPPGVVARHRGAHDPARPAVVVGPCRIPPETAAPAALRAWWDEFYATLDRTGTIDRFDRFTVANASAPARLIAGAGGFDERFTAYGLEDYELAVRLLSHEVPLRFEPEAFVWHPDVPPMSLLIRRQEDIGRNTALLAHLHPGTADLLVPPGAVPRSRHVLRRLRLRSPRSLRTTSRIAMLAWRLLRPLGPRASRPFEHLARAAAHAAGVAAGDPGGHLLDRLLGYPPRPATD